MGKRAWTTGLFVALAACTGNTADTFRADLPERGLSTRVEGARLALGHAEPPGPYDGSTPPPHPTVQLAPALETALPCDNVALSFDFDPAPRDFDVSHAFWMMWFAERAFFSDLAETRAELAQIGFDRYQSWHDASTGLQLYVAGSARAVVVAFRGSTELKDWLNNFDFPQDEGALHGVEGRVHRGFARSLTPAWPAIESSIRAFADAGQPVWLTGHSLGGAQATLAAARLTRSELHVAPLYVFAAPRAGDAVFAQDAHTRLSSRGYRIVNERDLVPHLPPSALAAEESARVLPVLSGRGASQVRDLDYRHLGQMVWFHDADGTDVTMLPAMSDADDEPYWAEAARGGSVGFITSNRKQGERHAQQRYLCRLLALRDARL